MALLWMRLFYQFLVGEMLFHFEDKCDCWSLDGCCQRDLNALTASWYDDLAGLLRPAEEEE